MPFDDDADDNQGSSKKPSLKLNNSNSILNTLPKKQNLAELEKRVKESQDNTTVSHSEASELSILYKKVMEDKTLSENKNFLVIEAEKELLGKIANNAININNDENEQEGMGSVGWILVVLRMLLLQRDKINKQEYLLTMLDKKIKSLSDKIDSPLVDKKLNE